MGDVQNPEHVHKLTTHIHFKTFTNKCCPWKRQINAVLIWGSLGKTWFNYVIYTVQKIMKIICRYRMNLGDFRHRCTMKLKIYIYGHENGRKSRKGVNNMWMNFSPTCRQKPECQCSTTIYCQHNSIFHRQKKLLFVYLTSQN